MGNNAEDVVDFIEKRKTSILGIADIRLRGNRNVRKGCRLIGGATAKNGTGF